MSPIMPSSVIIRPIDPAQPGFAGEVWGVDIARGVSAAEAAALDAGMDRFAVLVFRDQRISDEEQYAFSCHFGPMEKATGDIVTDPGARRLSLDINDISNLDRDGRVLARDDRRRLFSLGNLLWHSDSSFKPTPAKYSLLSARAIPGAGGNTEFADMRAAWDALDEPTKCQCRGLVCEHSQLFSRGILGFTDFTEAQRREWEPVPQRLVRRHPKTGRLSLFLSSHAGAIQGWPVPEGRAFLRDLTEHATERRFVYAHVWRPFDLVMWDNRVVMHRGRRYDHAQVRDMHRTTVADSAPTLQQPGP
ncbi:MAG TPA: TauD/TfdA family dioxygenase [Alphaproteobacteria bacterium]